MQWRLQILPDALVVRISGLPDHSFGEMFGKAAERAMSLENRKVLVDFSDLESMGPLGLTLCAYGLYHLQELGVSVALIQPPASLLPVLDMHGMKEFPIVLGHENDAKMLN
jgi:anti-anti-sigma regulatory factor